MPPGHRPARSSAESRDMTDPTGGSRRGTKDGANHLCRPGRLHRTGTRWRSCCPCAWFTGLTLLTQICKCLLGIADVRTCIDVGSQQLLTWQIDWEWEFDLTYSVRQALCFAVWGPMDMMQIQKLRAAARSAARCRLPHGGTFLVGGTPACCLAAMTVWAADRASCCSTTTTSVNFSNLWQPASPASRACCASCR